MVRKMCMTFLGAFIFVCLCNCLSVFSAHGENLRINSLKVTKKGSQSEFYLDHPIILTGKLSSDETVEDVGINFYIIEKGKEGEENAYSFIGFYYIAKLKAGTKKFKVEAQLPTDATAGNYYVVGVIDPLNMTEESNDEDNDYKTKKTIKEPVAKTNNRFVSSNSRNFPTYRDSLQTHQKFYSVLTSWSN